MFFTTPELETVGTGSLKEIFLVENGRVFF